MSSTLPFVSFIALSYNHARFLVETLNSIINQRTNVQFEIIITDDASKDNSVDLINSWIKENKGELQIKTIFNEKNEGLCKILNKAVSIASGKWIKPIACDDILDDSYLELIKKTR